MPAVGVVVLLVKLAMYAPGDDKMGLVGGTGGGPVPGAPGCPVGVDACCCCCCCCAWTGALIFCTLRAFKR